MLIDLEKELKNYKPLEPADICRDWTYIPDNVRNAVALYNKALEKLNSGSEDIAIIELRKAISLYPEFIEALNLLGICYLYVDEKVKAAEIFERIKNFNPNESKTVKYLQMIEREKSLRPVSDTASKAVKTVENQKKKTLPGNIKKTTLYQFSGALGRRRSYHGVVKFFFVLTVTIGLVLLCVFAAYQSKNFTEYVSGVTSVIWKNAYNQNNSDSDKINPEVDRLKDEVQNLKNELEAEGKELEYYKNAARLLEVEQLSDEKKYEDAADILVQLKGQEFRGIEKVRYDGLVNFVMPKAALTVYIRGNEQYNNKNFKEAADAFSKILAYEVNWDYTPWIMYALGVSYMELGKLQNAIQVFQDVQQKFPDNDYATFSSYKISEIQSILNQQESR